MGEMMSNQERRDLLGITEKEWAGRTAKAVSHTPKSEILQALIEAEARLHTLSVHDHRIGSDPTQQWVLGLVRAAIAKAESRDQ